jgi:hypothetical protein
MGFSSKDGFSDVSFYLWCARFGGKDVSESVQLKRLRAEAMLEHGVGGK